MKDQERIISTRIIGKKKTHSISKLYNQIERSYLIDIFD